MKRFTSVFSSGRAATVLGTLVIFVGVLVLLGWALDLEPLKRVFPTLVAMNPVTAVAFVLLGFAVPFSQAPPEERGLRRTPAAIRLHPPPARTQRPP